MMFFSDTSRLGVPFAKDPSVIEFNGRYLMYFSIPAAVGNHQSEDQERAGWGIGIAESDDLLHWKKVGELTPTQPIERNGIASPGARVIDGEVHVFYQTYGHGARDAICHATSRDGVHFDHDATNPVYRPTHMHWSIGRAIDPEILVTKNQVFMYFATRDRDMRKQMIGMAEAPRYSKLSAGDWKDVSTATPVLQPKLPWEGLCIEAPSVIKHGGTYYMYYAGAFNNSPQQIGVARSVDARHWTRISKHPFLRNGKLGSWNSSESGHPGVLQTGTHTYLFFQGNNDGGKTYHLSVVEIGWHNKAPYVMPRSKTSYPITVK